MTLSRETQEKYKKEKTKKIVKYKNLKNINAVYMYILLGNVVETCMIGSSNQNWLTKLRCMNVTVTNVNTGMTILQRKAVKKYFLGLCNMDFISFDISLYISCAMQLIGIMIILCK